LLSANIICQEKFPKLDSGMEKEAERDRQAEACPQIYQCDASGDSLRLWIRVLINAFKCLSYGIELSVLKIATMSEEPNLQRFQLPCRLLDPCCCYIDPICSVTVMQAKELRGRHGNKDAKPETMSLIKKMSRKI
jgi:hypothetical protein